MLVLSRKLDESIMVGDNIGITAPTEIPVHRQEVYEAIRREGLRKGGVA